MQLHCCTGVAKYVLDKCIPEGSHADNPKSELYEVAFDYEFIDDFQDSEGGHGTPDPE